MPTISLLVLLKSETSDQASTIHRMAYPENQTSDLASTTNIAALSENQTFHSPTSSHPTAVSSLSRTFIAEEGYVSDTETKSYLL